MKRFTIGLTLAVGSLALLAAMAVDFFSVVTRHLGVTVLGSVELVQLCVVLGISSALIIATVQGAHASVHILTERLPPVAARLLDRISDLFGALLFVLLSAGSYWMLSDTWGLDERTDVLRIPLAPARILWTTALAGAAVVFLIRAVAKPGPASDPAADAANAR